MIPLSTENLKELVHQLDYMASFLPPLSSLNPSFCKQKELTFKYPHVRCQSFGEDGTSANIVDANLGILRGRIAAVKMKERLDTGCKLKNGWNYQSGYDHKYKRGAMLSESLELMGFAIGAFGFVFLSGFLFIYLVSLLVHLS